MIIKHGDILSLTKGIIVHGCNAQGKYQSGVAGQIREKYPAAYEAYYNTYIAQGHKLELGQIIPVWVTEDLCIINAITQQFYGRDGKRYVSYDAVASAFASVVEYWCDYMCDNDAEETLIHFPQIGAGLGGGDWNQIQSIIEQALFDHMKNIPGVLWIYEK